MDSEIFCSVQPVDLPVSVLGWSASQCMCSSDLATMWAASCFLQGFREICLEGNGNSVSLGLLHQCVGGTYKHADS